MTAGAAGMDLHAAVPDDLAIEPGAIVLVPTGLEVAIPEGFEEQATPAILSVVYRMPEPAVQVEIPNRALFKAAEVCDIVKVQPYVLRSWETEFPELGVAKTAGGPRVYRRADVEQVVRIKNLLLVEGLTLAGARKRLVEEMAPVGADTPAIDELIGRNTRERLTEVKRGLRSILDLLAAAPAASEFRLSSSPATARVRAIAGSRAKPARGKTSSSRNGSRAAHARRKRSA
jgi:DNA-binding transcriptional MerR regulator